MSIWVLPSNSGLRRAGSKQRGPCSSNCTPMVELLTHGPNVWNSEVRFPLVSSGLLASELCLLNYHSVVSGSGRISIGICLTGRSPQPPPHSESRTAKHFFLPSKLMRLFLCFMSTLTRCTALFSILPSHAYSAYGVMEGCPHLPSRTQNPSNDIPFFQTHFIIPVLVLYERGHL